MGDAIVEYTKENVLERVKAICPESAKIPETSVKTFVEDAMFDCQEALKAQENVVKLRASAYLAAHYCAVNLYQRSQTFPEENFTEVAEGSVGTSGAGAIKVNSYKDKRQEFFEKRTTSQGSALVKWEAEITPSNASLVGTSYGQEFLRLLKLYSITEPFFVGNNPNEPLGRSFADYPGGRYRRW